MASASGLTTRTVAGRAGAEHQRADFAAADAAGLAAAAVDKQFLLEVPGCAIGTEEIAQGGAAALDRFGQHFTNPVGEPRAVGARQLARAPRRPDAGAEQAFRSEEHTSELQSLMRISYAVFCLKKKTKPTDR